jgi:hypothetical protein
VEVTVSQEFLTAEFLGLTLTEQISKCRAMASEAERLASVGSRAREEYRKLEREWTYLADEMECFRKQKAGSTD